MQKQKDKLHLWFSLILLFSLVNHGVWGAELKTTQTNQQQIQQRVGELQHIFGPIDFAREEPVELFEVMLYAWPQPIEAMKAVGDKQLQPGAVKHIDAWMQLLFREKFRPNIVEIKPTHYYMGGRYESDLLEFKWLAGGMSFRMLDNWNTILLMPEPESSGLKPEQGIAGQEVAKFLVKVLNLPYASNDETSKAFKLPKVLRIGDVFTNTDAKTKHPLLMESWQSFIVGFVGKNGLNVVCFKVRPDPAMRELDLRQINHWLTGNLLEDDGKTPVKRPQDDKPLAALRF